MLKKDTLSVTLRRSPIGRLPKHRACVVGLGLRKIGQTKVLEDTPSIRGMIRKIQDMVEVKYADSGDA